MDWTMALVIFQVLAFALQMGIFAVLKFNDLRHLGIDVANINKNMAELRTEFKKVSDKVIDMNARCEERHQV